MHSSDDNITASALDTLMQDTWLLVLAIRNNPPVTVDDALYQHCFDMIQQVQNKLVTAYAPEYLIEEIKFAHSVFIDEAVMTQPDTDVSTWWRRTPLQGHFLGHIHGGEHFCEHIKELLRRPGPSEALVTCYYRMLYFGYAEKYRTGNDEKQRLSLMRQLETLLPDIPGQQEHHNIVVSDGGSEAQWWRSPLVILISLLLLTAGIWAGLRLFLLAQ